MTIDLWPAPEPATLAVRDSEHRLPVYRLFFVGRNHPAHAREMGVTVDKAQGRPFYFTKSPVHLIGSGATGAYPSETEDFHHEVERVVVLGRGGHRVPLALAHELIYGYAVGLDMTRRDVRLRLRARGHPWCLGKDVEGSAICGAVAPMPGVALERGAITLPVNDSERQRADIADLIWNVRELIADLSRYYHLQPGDVIHTGTPEGVGAVRPSDRPHATIDGVGTVDLTIGPAV